MSRAGGGPRTGRVVLASIADQGVAALTNIAVVICVARQSTAPDFASFAVVYTVFTLLLGTSSAYTGQALVLRRGPDAELHRHCRAAAVFVPLVAGALGMVLAVATLFLPGRIAAGLGALGLVLPLVLGQDILRYAFSLLRVPWLALLTDVLRLTVAVPVLALQPYGSGPARMVLLWGLSAVPALLLGALLLGRVSQGAGRPRPWTLLTRGHLGRRFAVEFGVGNAGTQLAVIGLGLIAGPLVVGALRGATTLFGPMNVLFNAVTGFGPPLLGRFAARRQARLAAGAGGLLAVAAAGWALFLAVLPDEAGRRLLGDSWRAAADLLPASGSQYAAMAGGTCALLVLRVRAPRTTLPIQVVFSLLSVCALLAGYALAGVLGAAWGLCAGSTAKALASWARVASLERRPGRRAAERRRGSGCTSPTA